MAEQRGPTNCPKCRKPMAQRIVHSRGIVVCEERYLRTMWELQAAADAGRTGAEGFGGFADHVISMEPMDEEKFARCEYCYDCHVAVIARDGLIPPDQVPPLAKHG